VPCRRTFMALAVRDGQDRRQQTRAVVTEYQTTPSAPGHARRCAPPRTFFRGRCHAIPPAIRDHASTRTSFNVHLPARLNAPMPCTTTRSTYGVLCPPAAENHVFAVAPINGDTGEAARPRREARKLLRATSRRRWGSSRNRDDSSTDRCGHACRR
jgi:hypothetical protein